MIRQRAGSHTIAGAFVFLLLGVFAIFSVLMVLLCAGAYNRTTDHAEANNQAHIAPAYLRTMLRGHDEAGGIRIEHLTGIQHEDEDTGEIWVEPVDLDALILEDEDAVTRLFVYQGWLYECSEPKEEESWSGEDFDFAEEDLLAEETETDGSGAAEGVCPESAMQPVSEADGMETELEGGLLIIRLLNSGAWSELTCALHAAVP